MFRSYQHTTAKWGHRVLFSCRVKPLCFIPLCLWQHNWRTWQAKLFYQIPARKGRRVLVIKLRTLQLKYILENLEPFLFLQRRLFRDNIILQGPMGHFSSQVGNAVGASGQCVHKSECKVRCHSIPIFIPQWFHSVHSFWGFRTCNLLIPSHPIPQWTWCTLAWNPSHS